MKCKKGIVFDEANFSGQVRRERRERRERERERRRNDAHQKKRNRTMKVNGTTGKGQNVSHSWKQ